MCVFILLLVNILLYGFDNTMYFDNQNVTPLKDINILQLNEELKDYYPIIDGQKWEYLVSEDDEVFKQKVELKIIDSEYPDITNFVLQTKSKRETKYFFKLIDEIVLLEKIELKIVFSFNVSIKCSPELPVFRFNYNNNFIQWDGLFKSTFTKQTSKIKSDLIGFELVETKIGTFECLLIKSYYFNDGEYEWSKQWYAKGIGLVKQVSPKQSKEIIYSSK